MTKIVHRKLIQTDYFYNTLYNNRHLWKILKQKVDRNGPLRVEYLDRSCCRDLDLSCWRYLNRSGMRNLDFSLWRDLDGIRCWDLHSSYWRDLDR
ncbi:hypothetical protein DPMN_019824 [Dreissena polymorpha]|uniref:Uncharacterized protein n=1 Tax=Dreissena polymorpha TaxID=45954 RepID=A0A9D4NL46_DREPO|nr:hypothetical protein DPMN_019824 [Dreissena polymorpha]